MNLALFWLGPKNCAISSATETTDFAITNTKLYVTVATLSG